MDDGTAGEQVVGIDLHLHRSVIAGLDEAGEQLGWVRIDNDPKALVAECRKAGRGVPVAIEATYGWYWAVDALRAARFEVHLAHPLGMKALRKRKRTALAVRPPPPAEGTLELALASGVGLEGDAWLRAMHVLHVAARPGALPCREAEYGRVLRAVEELLEEGSGGCICACFVICCVSRGCFASGNADCDCVRACVRALLQTSRGCRGRARRRRCTRSCAS